MQVCLDNSSAVAYINRRVGTRSGSLWVLAKQILQWAKASVLLILAVHLKGELNQVADFFSRRTLREGNEVLNQDVYEMVTTRWGVPCVDLFASRRNAAVLLPEKVGWGARSRCACSELAFLQVLCLPPHPYYY